MPDEARPDPHEGVSRRDILKRAAIAGGLAWAAPAIQSITTPAFAQVTPGCMAGCFWVKTQPDGGGCEDANGTVFCPNCLADEGLTQDPGGCPCVAGRIVAGECDSTLTLPPGCTFHGGFSKCAGDLCEPAVDMGGGVIHFPPCPDPSPPPPEHCVSHIEFCYCCT